MKKHLVITDFDGTLLDDEKKIPRKNMAVLYEMKKNGVVSAIATGRSIESFATALTNMGIENHIKALPIDYILFSTGAGIMDYSQQKLIYERSLSTEDIRRIADLFDSLKIDYMIHKAMPDTHHLLYKSFDPLNTDFHQRLSFYETSTRPIERFKDQYTAATQLLGIVPPGMDMDRLVEIRRVLSEYSVIQATSPIDHRSVWIEVFHRGVSKSKSSAWLCRQLEIDRENTVAVGNDFNDQDLLEWAGRSYVVKNAPDVLRAKFETVPFNYEAGFSAAVKLSGVL